MQFLTQLMFQKLGMAWLTLGGVWGWVLGLDNSLIMGGKMVAVAPACKEF